MAAPARSSGPLAARIEAESARRGVPLAANVDEVVCAYLDDEPTDESVIAVGADAPTPALRELLRGL